MTQTVYINRPFAQVGTRTPIDDTRVDGVVNMSQGYTDDYSRELGVDPAAKAVERDKLNWLLNIITSNTIDWQTNGLPQWLSAIDYAPPALVRYTAVSNGEERIYRCLVDCPPGTLPTNTNFWEEVISVSTLLGRIPMPYEGSAVVGMDANTMFGSNGNGGFWTMESAAIVAGVANLPAGAQQGALESRRVASAGGYIQRYTDMGGNIWVRGRNSSGVWTAWKTFGASGNSLAAYGILDAMQNFTYNAPLGTTVNLNTLFTNPGTYHQPAVPAAGMNYPAQVPGTLTVLGNGGGSGKFATQLYSTVDNLYVRTQNNGVNGAWITVPTQADVNAKVNRSGDSMTGDLIIRKGGPILALASPGIINAYRFYSNVSDTVDGGLLMQRMVAGTYQTIMAAGVGFSFYDNVSTRNGGNISSDGDVYAKLNMRILGAGTEHNYRIESTAAGVRNASFVTNNSPNTGLYDITNASWIIRYDGARNTYLAGTAYAVNGFQPGSSRRLKDIEGENPYGLDELMQLETVVGRYKPQYGGGGARRIFHIAENVGDVMPELMDPNGVQMPVLDDKGQPTHDEDGKEIMESFPSYSLDMMSAVHTKSIQQLAGLVEELTEICLRQKQQIDELVRKVG